MSARLPGGAGTGARNPHVRRFLLRCERVVGFWVGCLGIALLLAAVGIFPSLVALAGFLGVAWVPVVVLILWGRLLEDMGFRPPDRGGCS